MDSLTLTEAIQFLKPTAEFSLIDGDYSTIKWDKLEGDAPTLAEIEKAVNDMAIAEAAELKAKETAKNDLLAKLGITADEAKLLLS